MVRAVPTVGQTKEETIAAAISAMRSNRPLRAEEICRDYLLLNPGSTEHLRLLTHALMKQNRLAEAESQCRFALTLVPDMPLLREDLGSIHAMQNRFDEAIACFEKALQLEPNLPLARKKLGQALAALGRGEEADAVFEEYLERDPDKGAVAAGVQHLKAGRKDEAIATFRDALKRNPENVDAMRYLANVYLRDKENLSDAEALLRRATQIAPDFTAAWIMLGAVLHEAKRNVEAIDCYRTAVGLEPDNAFAWGALGNACAYAGYPAEAAEAYAKSVSLDPEAPAMQMGYAHVLKTLGDQAGSLDAYRAAIKAKPDFGEVYWSMANLKVFRFEDAEVAAMEEQVQRDDLTTSADIHFRFALGKAYEDKGDYETAWKYYDSGNKRQRMQVSHDAQEMEIRQHDIREVFSREFLEEHAGNGFDAPDPILIVGLPRSGSTLIEQILASHSQVEGTAELSNLSKIATSIGRYRPDNVQYPKSVKDLRKKDWCAYGRQYIDETRRHRLADKPFFTDKLPNNFPHVGFVHLILPNAKIINARRHPLDSCLGGYKQLFGKGQNFTYDMFDLAEYYRQYYATMQHWKTVLPGKVLDVHYEETVTDLDGQVRRILDHCGLPFEQACVRFHETARAVQTASSEQVRRPIFREALGKWRRYENYLDLWKEELADIIDELPDAVKNAGL
ncbi:MAG: tetratricopeptide repeat-containing sulfotransferase family protein [Woeseiaceae bacterium]